MLAQLVGQLIEVCLSAEDQSFLCFLNVFRADRVAPVTAGLAAKASFVREGVDEPGLASAASGDRVHGVSRELLAGLLRVLIEQRLHFLRGEVAEPHGGGLDVECAAGRR